MIISFISFLFIIQINCIARPNFWIKPPFLASEESSQFKSRDSSISHNETHWRHIKRDQMEKNLCPKKCKCQYIPTEEWRSIDCGAKSFMSAKRKKKHLAVYRKRLSYWRRLRRKKKIAKPKFRKMLNIPDLSKLKKKCRKDKKFVIHELILDTLSLPRLDPYVFKNLRILELSLAENRFHDNRINSLAFSGTIRNSLQVIDLSMNKQLTRIPQQLYMLNNLQHIWWDDNQAIECNCKVFAWTFSWKAKSIVSITNYDSENIKCDNLNMSLSSYISNVVPNECGGNMKSD
ncbi:hypothetical protein SNEBB_005026 [Seison nebaliae]|nr:hypothetical protein SNEBB_005026 [Seison nebaliae]